MTLPADLLEQAQHLIRRERGRPRQASLRRGISAAYYALFHLLIEEASAMLVTEDQLRSLVGRAFAHNDMKQASQAFATAQLPKHVNDILPARSIPSDLQVVAAAFVEMQDRRHEADYKHNRKFTRSEASTLMERVRQAFQAWQRVRQNPAAKIYLAALVLWNKWNK